MAINMTQPMRPAEIDLVIQVNTNTDNIETNHKAISQEVVDRTNADAAIGNRITEETNARNQSDTKLQGSIDSEMTRAKAAEEANAQAISQEVVDRTNADAKINEKFPVGTGNIADNSVTNSKLEGSIQQQLAFLQTVPAMEYGTSSSVDVPANSSATVDIAFRSVKTEVPVVLCSLKHTSGKIACVVSGVTNNQCSIIVYNLTSTDVAGLIVDYLAISGR